MTHELKIAPKYFEYVKDWSKPFELRKNDRNYQPGDIVILKEFSIISGTYSGRQAIRKISYVLKNCPEYGLDKDYCIIGFAFEPIADKPQALMITSGNDLKRALGHPELQKERELPKAPSEEPQESEK